MSDSMSDKIGQRGFALVEFVASMAVSALIAGAAGISLFQVFDSNHRNNDRSTALHEVDNSHYWIGKDARSASSTNLVDGGPPAGSMNLSWVDGSGVPHSSSYALSGTQLRRSYDGAVLTVARNISSIQFSRSGRLVTATLTSSPGASKYDESRSFYVYLRPEV